MNESRDEAFEPLEGTGSGRSVLQQWGAIFGFFVMILGVILSLVIFFKILGFISDPTSFKESVDQMEIVLMGSEDAAREVAIQFNQSGRGAGGAPIAGQQAAPELPIRDITIPTSFARTASAGLIVLMLFVLARLAIGIASVGGKLIALANPYKQMYERIKKDFKKAR